MSALSELIRNMKIVRGVLKSSLATIDRPYLDDLFDGYVDDRGVIKNSVYEALARVLLVLELLEDIHANQTS